jgi:hypothetical protein
LDFHQLVVCLGRSFLAVVHHFLSALSKMRGFNFSFGIALVTAAAANAAFLDTQPDFALIQNRQAPGTPQFACHENCGKFFLLSNHQ